MSTYVCWLNIVNIILEILNVLVSFNPPLFPRAVTFPPEEFFALIEILLDLRSPNVIIITYFSRRLLTLTDPRLFSFLDIFRPSYGAHEHTAPSVQLHVPFL